MRFRTFTASLALMSLAIIEPALPATAPPSMSPSKSLNVDKLQPVNACEPGPGSGDMLVLPGQPGIPLISVVVDPAVTSSMNSMTGLPGGRRQRGEITLTKAADSASPNLFSLASTNESLPTVKLTLRKAGGPSSSSIVYTLSQAAVKDMEITRSGPSAPATERIVLTYESVAWCSTHLSEK